MKRALIYFHTLRNLKSQQIVMQIWYRIKPVHRVSISKKSCPPLREIKQHWRNLIYKSPSLTAPCTFRFLNHEVAYKKEDDFWHDQQQSKLWQYHLHYFDILHEQEASITSEDKLVLMQHWIEHNPMGKGIGWNSYPISLRIVNWIKWHLLGNALNQPLLESLWQQACFLRQRMEYHILGNHLFENIKALLFTGLFFQGKKADTLFDRAQRQFIQQLHEQVLADGAHFELSPMYHALILEGVLDVIQLYQRFAIAIPPLYIDKAKQMLTWLSSMIHPDGDFAFFNDTTLQMAPTYRMLCDYASALHIEIESPLSFSLLHEHSGYGAFDLGIAALKIDAAEVGSVYQPGHAHADTLSFELSLFQQRVLVNSGISTYVPSELRLQQRATAAHNTLQCDEQNSSQVWSAFRVAKRAHIVNRSFKIEKNFIQIIAAHNGYRDLPGSPIHQREWQLTQSGLTIVDTLTGLFHHEVNVYYHFHPKVTVTIKNNIIRLTLSNGQEITMQVFADVTLQASHFYSEFGRAIPNKTICVNSKGILPLEIICEMKWPGF